MKFTVAFTIMISLLANCTYSAKQPNQYRVKGLVVVSERVGEVIDADEREYFNLLSSEIYVRPVTYRYETAALHAIAFGGYEVRISTANNTLVVVNRDTRGIEILRDYIDNYETVVESRQAFEEKWGIIDYDPLGQPITKDEMLLTEERMSSVWKSPSSTFRSIMIGASLGGCVGGVVGFLLSDRETEYEITDPGAEGVLACFERTSIALAVLGGSAVGMAGGGLAGAGVGAAAKESRGPAAEEASILEAIKESRQPRVMR
jgi:hypothetical protein